MSSSNFFRAFDPTGRNPHIIPEVYRIDQHRLRAGEWPMTKNFQTITPRIMEELVEKILHTANPSDGCEHCGAIGPDPTCNSTTCYHPFTASHLPNTQIELRGPGPVGYGTFLKKGATLPKHAWLGEYLGELRPLGHVDRELGEGLQSMYRFDFEFGEEGGREDVVLDSERAGNWTRFMNSSCEPNCEVWASVVGKRLVYLFRTKREIFEGEELTFFYGEDYFEAAGMLCRCDGREGMHKAERSFE